MNLDIIIAVQQFSSPFFDAFFQVFTMLGEEAFFIASLTFIYWCISKEYGAKFSYIFFFSMFSNSILKTVLQVPRPIGTEGVRTLREHTATGLSFPSGHTQSTTSFWYYLMITLRKPWLTAAGIIIIMLMALSRLYLGVHWPTDVIGAVAFGILFVHIGEAVYRIGYRENTPLLPLLIAAASIPLVFVFQDGSYTIMAGILSGASVGFLIEQRYIGFTIPENMLLRLRNFIFGMLVLFFIRETGKLLLPPHIVSDLIQYTLIGFWAAAGAPWAFKAFRKL